MIDDRVVTATAVAEFSAAGAVSTQVVETDDAAVFVWGLEPGQAVRPHVHPDGQDTWVMVQGILTYYFGDGETIQIAAGDIDVAPREVVHGA